MEVDMKKSMVLNTTAIAFIIIIFLTKFSFAQENNAHQNKSYVKIRTMKIVNGDTIVSEKEYTGEGDMNIQDSLMGNSNGSFHFKMFNNSPDSSFFKGFSDMENMFKNFNFGTNESIFNNFKFPQFPNMNMNFGIDSIIKEFNFQDTNSYFPSLGENKMIIKSFKNDDLQKLADSAYKARPGMDVQVFGKDEKGNPITYNKRIIIQNNTNNTPKQNNNDEFQVDVFPNPADSFFNVSFTLDPKNKTIITITDINGKQLQKETIDKSIGIYTRQFDMKDYSKGTYIINIKQGKKTVSKQIVIE